MHIFLLLLIPLSGILLHHLSAIFQRPSQGVTTQLGGPPPFNPTSQQHPAIPMSDRNLDKISTRPLKREGRHGVLIADLDLDRRQAPWIEVHL